jgi:hypothetical protein
MTVSRRLRFEILRRDGHTCRYCGAKAPDVALTVDHVLAVALGGGDEPNNLVTACVDCNSGKSSTTADAALVEDVDATAMLFAKAVERAAALRRQDAAALADTVRQFGERWDAYRTGDGDTVPRDGDWENSAAGFYARGLTLEDLSHFVAVAMSSQAALDRVWRYFCGCCWREIADRDELARRLIEDGQV